jgi:diguanylate cyclase (GGDEF)-like protein
MSRQEAEARLNEALAEVESLQRAQAERERATRIADEERDALIELALTDELTGLPNRRAWDAELRRELARARRHEWAACAVMLDLDYFKVFNDSHGHQAGDRLLAQAAAAWKAVLRETDFVARYGLVARYGGEEFAVILPDCPLEPAIAVTERLRAAVPRGQTCSAGIASWDGSETGDALIGRADAALYEAKRFGRDRAAVANGSPAAVAVAEDH